MSDTPERFYPKGHFGPHHAALLLAKARYPDRWQESAMSDVERNLWHWENDKYGHLFLGDILGHEIGWGAQGTRDRWSDFSEALTDIRRALDSGLLVARFRHADGAWDKIERESWAIEVATDVLLSGFADLKGAATQRVVLIQATELASAFPVVLQFTTSAKDPEAVVGAAALGSMPRDSTTTKGRRGRKPVWDWQAIGAFAIEMLDENGRWSADDPEWNCQACLEREIQEFCQTRFGHEPAVSAIRQKITQWVAQFEAKRATA